MSAVPTVSWDHADPFIIDAVVAPGDIDLFGHTNHQVYHRWFAEAAWAHSRSDGLTEAVTQEENAGMALLRTEVDYLAHGREADAVKVGVWITRCDGRLRAERRFQVIRPADGKTLARARWEVACFDLSTGRPRRMPGAFTSHYRKTG